MDCRKGMPIYDLPLYEQQRLWPEDHVIALPEGCLYISDHVSDQQEWGVTTVFIPSNNEPRGIYQ